MITSWLRRIPNLVAGALAGIAAAIVMTLAMLASRYWLGVMPLVEAVPDRVASLLSVQEFFRLFGQYGGYNGLKQFGILSGLRGVAATGLTVGVLYALVIESAPSRRSPRWLLGSNRPSLLFMMGAILAVWIGFVIFLWPILPANYIGVPFTWARILTIVAMLAWFTLFAVTLVGSYRFMTRRPAATPADDLPRAERPIARASNRRAIVVAAGAAALTWPITGLLRRLFDDATFPYDGQTFHRETITPITPTELFYTVTKNVVDPDVNADLWRLEIGGHVRDARTYSLDDLQGFEQIDQETTLMCISNRVGSGLFGNAAWRGVRLRDLLDASGVEDGAFEVLVSSADGYSDSFAMDRALAEVTLVVYEMNGEPINRVHGGPARVIVPGLYGEKNVKWVTRVSVETEDKKGLYESQGWGPNFTPILRSDIFAPLTGGNDARGGWRFNQQFRATQPIEIKGRAFDPNLGIATVELSTDGGSTWNPTEIYYPGTDITWSLWTYTWTPPAPGEYVLIPRATSKTGERQPAEATSIVPDGAQGYQKVTATIVT
ncbi:MAG: molybdopterin-dependent oxidoreductase [Chloroflexota bacterium]|nr:molybdopterin-dependent oxidoreductase [Chloroflexota bacterium]